MKKKRSGCGCFGWGCLSVIGVGLLVFAISFSVIGGYKPVVPPPVTLTPTNGFNDYVAAGKMLKANGGTRGAYLNAGMTAPGNSDVQMPLNVKRILVRTNQRVLLQIRQAKGKQTVAPSARRFGDLFPYLADERELARLLAADIDVRLQARDAGGAMQSALDGIQMTQDMRRGGGMIHGLVSAAAQTIVLRSIVDHLEELSTVDCDRAAIRLQALLEARPTAGETREDRNATLASISTASVSDIVAVTSLNGTNGPLPVEQQSLGDIGWHFMRDSTLHGLERSYDAQLIEWGKPASLRQPAPEPTSLFVKVFTPDFQSASRRFDQADVQARLLLIALKIRSSRLKRGSLPKNLAELGLPSALTTDPFSGQPFLYKPQGAGFLLYSVGYNFTDDGGVSANEANFQTVPQGDLGVRSFRYNSESAQHAPLDHVPYMKPPSVRKNAP